MIKDTRFFHYSWDNIFCSYIHTRSRHFFKWNYDII